MLTVPPPPKFAFPTRFGFPKIPFEYGQPFQCPYCFTEQTVENRSAWKTHVFRDLKPYVCTFSECEMLMFRSRNEWFAHELQNHRREWACQFCQHSPFTTVSDFSKHTETAHAAVLRSSPLKALIMISEEPIDNILSTACPLCDDWETDMVRKQAILESVCPSPNRLDKTDGLRSKPKLFRRHLGRHMEQLALFALPPNHFSDLEDGSTDGEKEEVDDDSSNKEDYLSEGHQSASETQAPHINEPSPDQYSLELDESRLPTASQGDELQRHGEVARDFEFEQQDKQGARPTKDRELGEEEAEELVDERPDIGDSHDLGDVGYERRSSAAIEDRANLKRDKYELEKARREIEEIKTQFEQEQAHKEKSNYITREECERELVHLDQLRIKEEELLRNELKFKLLLKQKEEEEMEAAKKAAEAAVNDYQRKEAERALVGKKEKGGLDKEYKERLEEDLRKSGLTDQQIAAVIEKGKVDAVAGTRPMYTRMARRYLSFETLNAFRIDYTIDQDPDYILIKRWVPEHEQDFLW
ncbi:hypothetical protein V498_10372, partial [Pseudogymnoascus sp. VKM F-4517 (FW-2822)]